MEMRQLKAFATVARSLSFSRAAEELDYAQSSVSSQIQSLEQELGTTLFERLGRKIALTEDGAKLLVYAEQILQLAAAARQAVPGAPLPKGTLTIGAPESLCAYRLPVLLQEYRRRYPDVELVLKTGSYPDFDRCLLNNTLDLAFIINREIAAPMLVSETLLREPMVLLAAPGHPIIEKGPLKPADLQGESLILTETGCYRSVLDRILAEAGILPGSVLELGSLEGIKQLVGRGMGITLLPYIVAEQELATGQLVDLGWEGPGFRIATQLVYHKDKWISPALRAMLDLTRAMIGPGSGT